MLNQIDSIIKDIEDIKQEIEILLKMHKISFVEFVMIKRGAMDFPEHLEMWRFEQISAEALRLKEKIDELNKIKKEYLVW